MVSTSKPFFAKNHYETGLYEVKYPSREYSSFKSSKESCFFWSSKSQILLKISFYELEGFDNFDIDKILTILKYLEVHALLFIYSNRLTRHLKLLTWWNAEVWHTHVHLDMKFDFDYHNYDIKYHLQVTGSPWQSL